MQTGKPPFCTTSILETTMKKQTNLPTPSPHDLGCATAEFEEARSRQQAANQYADLKEQLMLAAADERDQAAIELGKAMQVVERLQRRLSRKKKKATAAAEAFADAKCDWRMALADQDDKQTTLMRAQQGS